MNFCNDNHDEVCYEVRNCPVCAVVKKKDALEDLVDELKDEISGLKEEK